MNSIIRGCIFDLDGVIVDTAKYHYLAWKRLAEELGSSFSKKDNERLKGVSRMDSLEILLQILDLNFDEDTKLALAAKKNKWYVEYITSMKEDEILPGVMELMKKIKAAGLKSALGSVSKNAMTILDGLKLTAFFDAIIDGNKVSKAKPDPEVFLLAARELGLSPEECVVFEDAKAGIEAARRAGMRCIGVGEASNLKDADIVIPGFINIGPEVLKIIGIN